MAEKSWLIQTEELQVGTTLSFDLVDSNGQMLHKAGMPISEKLKEKLVKRNIHSVTVQGLLEDESEQYQELLFDSYPAATIAHLQSSIRASQDAILNLAQTLRDGKDGEVGELREGIDDFVHQAQKNLSATLAMIATKSKLGNQQIADRLACRSTHASLLSIAMSVTKNDDPAESFEIGLAAMLHDVSLLLHPEWFSQELEPKESRFWDDYRRHPIESAELLNSIKGISTNTIRFVTQVHEQIDGTGYPRGLRQKQIPTAARILNLSDAYLSLTEPIMGKPYAPSDALAYLCHHTALGLFCKESLQRMLQSMSLYPIGSVVLLDDETKAIVIKATPGNPLKPVVRLIDRDNLRIDLSTSSRLILGPHIDSKIEHCERIEKNQLSSVLWRTDR